MTAMKSCPELLNLDAASRANQGLQLRYVDGVGGTQTYPDNIVA